MNSNKKKGDDEESSYFNIKDQYTYETAIHDIFDPVHSSFVFTDNTSNSHMLDMKNEILTLKGSQKPSLNQLNNNNKVYNFDRFHMTQFSESCLPSMQDILEIKQETQRFEMESNETTERLTNEEDNRITVLQEKIRLKKQEITEKMKHRSDKEKTLSSDDNFSEIFYKLQFNLVDDDALKAMGKKYSKGFGSIGNEKLFELKDKLMENEKLILKEKAGTIPKVEFPKDLFRSTDKKLYCNDNNKEISNNVVITDGNKSRDKDKDTKLRIKIDENFNSIKEIAE